MGRSSCSRLWDVWSKEEKKVSFWEWCTQGGEGNLQRWEWKFREVTNHRLFIASGGGKTCLTRGQEGISCGNGNVL